MSNTFMNGLKMASNYTRTENGALTHKTTTSALLDLFAMGAAYRTRSEEDCILLFRNAFAENPTYALKCLFYIADVRGGQGERRFFRVCINDLAKTHPEVVRRNLELIPIYRRWDDLYALMDTPLENAVFLFMKKQLALDVQSKTPSLLGKWLKSENASSKETKALAIRTRKTFGMTAKQYRKTLSYLRERINVLERLMSAGKWDEIEFDKIPSRAGLIYKNAFARHDVERAKSEKNVQTYADFAKDETKSVNAKALYPYEVVDKGLKACNLALDDTDRLMVNKYWDNLEDYFKGKNFNGLAVVDTSASMTWHGGADRPLNVAISLGMYCAERASGPFAGHYVSFSSRPQLIKVEGVDFCDKVKRIYRTNLCENTNIEATFDMLLRVAVANGCTQEELPQSLIVISDMEFDVGSEDTTTRGIQTLMESIRSKWAEHGYILPHLIYWNCQARQDNIPDDIGCGLVSFISGMSPSIFDAIMSGKTGLTLMYEKLDSERYAPIK